MPASRPNILFIVVDDCGSADLGCTGQTDYQTPALDRLAAPPAFGQSALCTESSVCPVTRPLPVSISARAGRAIALERPPRAGNGGAPRFPYLAVIAARRRLSHRAYREMASRIFAALQPLE